MRASSSGRVRRPRRNAADAQGVQLSGGNQQKVVVAREVSNDPRLLIAAQPTRGLDVGAIEFVHAGWSPSVTRGAASFSCRSSSTRSCRCPTASSSCTRGDRRRVRARGHRAGRSGSRCSAGRGGGPRHERGPAGVGAAARSEPGGYTPKEETQRFSARWHRAGGLVVPLVTDRGLGVLLAGLVVLVTTGHNPLSRYRAISNGTGLAGSSVGSYSIGLPFSDTTVWFPWTRASVPDAVASAADADSDEHVHLDGTRGCVRLPLRPLQHRRSGSVHRGLVLRGIWVGSSFARDEQLRSHRFAIVAAALAGAVWAGIAGILKATVGAHEVDHDDHAQLDRVLDFGLYLFGQGGPLQNTLRPSVRRRTPWRRPASFPSSGEIPYSRELTSASSSRSGRSSSSG